MQEVHLLQTLPGPPVGDPAATWLPPGNHPCPLQVRVEIKPRREIKECGQETVRGLPQVSLERGLTKAGARPWATLEGVGGKASICCFSSSGASLQTHSPYVQSPCSCPSFNMVPTICFDFSFPALRFLCAHHLPPFCSFSQICSSFSSQELTK